MGNNLVRKIAIATIVGLCVVVVIAYLQQTQPTRKVVNGQSICGTRWRH